MKLIAQKSVLLLASVLFLSSCQEEYFNQKYKGKYGVLLGYNGEGALPVDIYINDVKSGDIVLKPDMQKPYIVDCKDLENGSSYSNVFSLNSVPNGEHTLLVKNRQGKVLKTLDFKINNGECVLQSLKL